MTHYRKKRKNIKYIKIQLVKCTKMWNYGVDKCTKMWNYGVDLAEPCYTRNEVVILVDEDDAFNPRIASQPEKWIYDSGSYMINLDTCEFHYRLHALDRDIMPEIYWEKLEYIDKMDSTLGLIDPRQWVRERHQRLLNDEYEFFPMDLGRKYDY